MPAAPYTLTPEDADVLLVLVSASTAGRQAVMEHFLGSQPPAAVARLFSEFIGLAKSTVENCREMAELLLITEGNVQPTQAEKINMPTLVGALNGVRLADGVSEEGLCAGCAFRLGTVANQSPVTTTDAADCSEIGGQTFLCHEDLDDRGQPFKGCRGFAQARAQQKRDAVQPTEPRSA